MRRPGPSAASNRRRTSPQPDLRPRLLVLLGVFLLVAVLLLGVLADLQTLRPDRYRALGEDQRLRTVELAGYRGSIVDRNGFVLASSTPGRELVADPSMIVDPAAAAALLAPATGEDPSALAVRLTPDTDNDRFELVIRTSDTATIELLGDILAADRSRDERMLDGLVLRSEEARVYPAGTLGRTVVGRVDDYEQGIYGLEEEFDDLLRGAPGTETTERGIFGSIAGGFWDVDPAQQGYDLVLTIDHRIQFITEEALIDHCEETGARGAQAVVSDPRSGEILAMANVMRREDGSCSVPGYNANLIDVFEPGSVLKVVAVAAAVEELGYQRNDTIEIPDSIEVGDYTFHETNGHVAAPYPVSDVLARSMNVGTIKLASEVGPEILHHYYERFGFGSPSGLGLEVESRGRLHDWQDWYGSDLGSIAIGQGVLANSVQVMAAYNTLANDGLYIAPRLVREVISSDGTTSEVRPQEARRVLSAGTADEVTAMLEQVVERGTGTAASVPSYDVAGKTGTAWKVFEGPDGSPTYGSEGDRRYIMSFAGFLPADDPRISIVVTVDEPEVGRSAGVVAAPVFADIAQYSLRILGVPPEGAAADGQLVRGTVATVDGDPATGTDSTEPAGAAPADATASDNRATDESASGGDG